MQILFVEKRFRYKACFFCNEFNPFQSLYMPLFCSKNCKKPCSKWCRQYLLDIGGFILKYCLKKSGKLYVSCRESWKVYLLIIRCLSTSKFWAIARKIAKMFVSVVCEYLRIPTSPWYIKWAHCAILVNLIFVNLWSQF